MMEEDKTGFVLHSMSAEQTWGLGRQIGQRATGGEVIGLHGPFGSGKTVFVQGLAAGLGITASKVTSPSFVIMNHYPGRLPLCHIDLYRLDAPLETIGIEEYLEWEGVTAIEWVEKGMVPALSLLIELTPIGENERKIMLNFPAHPASIHFTTLLGAPSKRKEGFRG